MALSAGARLAGYEIISLLGQGGMGEVYKATDTRLARSVAIKILPAHIADDLIVRQRFEREAQALAALNDPHICAVFDVGRHEGIDFVVMEYLDGQTLADRLARGALPIGQALDVAIQIADGLDRAHRQGIVHRDLKPGNIMLTKSGSASSPPVKLLDFGLAKLAASSIQAEGATIAPTLAAPLTATGAILGTFQYMSPEQVEGADADSRSDIFAFGAVLYEMLTGKRAFDGKSQASVIAAILERQPPPVSSVQPVTPPSLDRLVSACLAKDPDERWQSARDVSRQLRSIAEEGRSASGTVMPAVLPSVRATATRRWGSAAALVVAGVVAGAAASAVWLMGNRATPAASTTQRLSIVTPADHPLVFTGGVPNSSLAMSPDGRYLAYMGRDGLELRSMESLAVTSLPDSRGVQAFFSPDSHWLAFISGDRLRKVAVTGGNPVTLLDHFTGEAGFGDWADDGTIVVALDGALFRISADGGTPEALTTPKDERHSYPSVVRGANAVLFTVAPRGAREPRIEVLRLDSRERKVLIENARTPRSLASGHLLFQRDDGVFAVPWNPKTMTVTGPAIPLSERIRREGQFSAGDYPQLAVSVNGTFAYVPGEGTTNRLGWVDSAGNFEPIDIPPDRMDVQRVSPDGKLIAFEMYATSGIGFAANNTVLVYDLARKGMRNLGGDRMQLRWPAWRPNGRELAVFSRAPARGIFLIGLDGSQKLITSKPDEGELRPGSWSPDGNLLAYTVQQTGHRIWITGMDGTPSQPLATGKGIAYAPRFSPDGKWIAYASTDSGRLEVYVKGYPSGAPVQISFNGGSAPVWRPDGKEIFFQTSGPPKAMLVAVPVTISGATVQPGAPRKVFDLNVTTPDGLIEVYRHSNNYGPRFDIGPDGRFLVARGADPENTREIVIVQNWFAELNRLAPRK
jgi:serine/threonine protein kinase